MFIPTKQSKTLQTISTVAFLDPVENNLNCSAYARPRQNIRSTCKKVDSK